MKTRLEALKELKKIKASSTWLQGIGCHAGKPAAELEAGDEIVWNYGETSKVISIDRETKAFVFVTTECEIRGELQQYESKFKKTRIVAIKGMFCYPGITQEDLRFVTSLS